jgi:hypothetical protein
MVRSVDYSAIAWRQLTYMKADDETPCEGERAMILTQSPPVVFKNPIGSPSVFKVDDEYST